MMQPPEAMTPPSEHKIVVHLERLDRHAVGILMPAGCARPQLPTAEGGNTVAEWASVMGVAEDRPTQRAHESHLVG
jgi:hypothetical protein